MDLQHPRLLRLQDPIIRNRRGLILVPVINQIINERLIGHIKDFIKREERPALVKVIDEMRSILYVQTSDDPERQYSPLVLAQSAKAMDIEAKAMFGLTFATVLTLIVVPVLYTIVFGIKKAAT